jgi:hypothetical protein
MGEGGERRWGCWCRGRSDRQAGLATGRVQVDLASAGAKRLRRGLALLGQSPRRHAALNQVHASRRGASPATRASLGGHRRLLSPNGNCVHKTGATPVHHESRSDLCLPYGHHTRLFLPVQRSGSAVAASAVRFMLLLEAASGDIDNAQVTRVARTHFTARIIEHPFDEAFYAYL